MSRQIHVGLLGLGTISQTHLQVLEKLDSVQLVFTVDPDKSAVSFRGSRVEHYQRLDEALTRHEIELAVIATPTSTHLDLVDQVLRNTSARVLVEKPLVHDTKALTQLLALAETGIDLHGRLFVAHHFAFSPEVQWAARVIFDNPSWGPLTEVTCAFYDPYVIRGDEPFESYESSWVDSGINQLSMLTRFLEFLERETLLESDSGRSAWSSLGFVHRGNRGLCRLRTSWMTGASSKSTVLSFAGSGVGLWLDHTAMTGFVAVDDKLLAAHVNNGIEPRKIAHYRPLYESILTESPDPAARFETAVTVTRLLHGEN